MDRDTLVMLRKRLDATVLSLAEMIKQEIYNNVILATVNDWFQGNDSVQTLNENIKRNVSERWPYIEKKINARLLDFEEKTKATIGQASGPSGGSLDQNAISEGISQGISVALGALGSAIVAMICGGAGTALIASGPVGWVIGAIIGGVAYFFGKAALEEKISEFIADKKIPKLAKRPAKKKVLSQLRLNESKFEEEIHGVLVEKLKPVYEAIDEGLSE